jgi:hypothetical protein
LNEWDISNVDRMRDLFYQCESLNEYPEWY